MMTADDECHADGSCALNALQVKTQKTEEGRDVEPEDDALVAPPNYWPDLTKGFDDLGPFEEVPSKEQEENPQPAIKGWDNVTDLQAQVHNTWGRSFCTAHRVGTWCDQYTQVRCCKSSWGFQKCGTTAHSTRCGWHGGGGPVVGGGGAWVIHAGWRQSSFCRSHHTGYFCFQRKKVHCCNDRGHFVECTTLTESHWGC